MRTFGRIITTLALALLCALRPSVAQAEPIAVIVNKSNPTLALTLDDVAGMYRGEELRWSYGKRIKLVNREISSTRREQFYRGVLNAKSNQRFYRPGTPVAIQSLIQRSDDSVLRFVAAIDGAIGYIAASHVDRTVKVVLIIDPEVDK